MEMRRITMHIDGMTCAACEARVRKALLGVPGVAEAGATLRGGKASVVFDPGATNETALAAAVVASGYAISSGREATWTALGIGAALSALYLFLSAKGIFNSIPSIDTSIGYGMLFAIGLLTSIHCVSMCGGIALSQSLGRSEKSVTFPIGRADSSGPMNPRANPSRMRMRLGRLTPGFLYNAGRVVGYTAIGAAVGGLGSVLAFSQNVKGLIAGAAGLFMVLFGLRAMGILALPRGLRLPASLRRAAARVKAALGGRGPFVVGVLNAFMPCGPLQAMQLYALGTGSAILGGLSMLLFSLGTTPLMFGFSLAATAIPRKFAPLIMKASAVLVIVLGVATFARAASLAGLPLPGLSPLAAEPAARSAEPSGKSATPGKAAPAAPAKKAGFSRAQVPDGVPIAEIKNGVQYVETRFTANEYASFAVKDGVPVKWTVVIGAADLNGCNRSLIVPAYGIRKDLKPGENLIEFTPSGSGVVGYSCWMGMIRSAFAVLYD